MNRLESLLKDYYRFSDEEYQSWCAAGDVANIPDPAAKTLVFSPLIAAIRAAAEAGRRFIVYGDYDCDGITSTAILVGSLRRLGADVGFFIPSRYREGYGLSAERLEQFAAKGYDFLLTVDNGITKVAEVAAAKKLGFTVAVIDHHEAPAELPTADFIFQQFICGLTDYNISAAFLALTVSRALLGFYDDYFVTLAGIAVLSDLMPLKGANVDLVRLAIANLKKQAYPPLTQLLNPANPIDCKSLNYEIIPVLNAPGRLCEGLEVNDAVRLLLSSSAAEAHLYAQRLIGINARRKELVNREYDPSLTDTSGPIVFFDSALPVGLGGLIANRIFSSCRKPVVVFTALNELTVGSIRTPEGYDTVASLREMAVDFCDFGGHRHAAGFTIKSGDVPLFKAELSRHLQEVSEAAAAQPAIELTESDLTAESLEVLSRFEPFGTEHEAPTFALRAEVGALASSRSNPKHIITNLAADRRIVFFNGRDQLPKSGSVLLLGTLKKNSFNGRVTYDFAAEKVGGPETILAAPKVDV